MVGGAVGRGEARGAFTRDSAHGECCWADEKVVWVESGMNRVVVRGFLSMSIQEADVKLRPAWARYGVAVGCVVVGWLAREALTPVLGATALPFVSFFPAATMAAWYGGFGPGVLATILAGAVGTWFFTAPLHSFAVSDRVDVIRLPVPGMVRRPVES